LQVERLEVRSLLSGFPGPTVVLQPVPNETQDQAPLANLGDLTLIPAARAWGSIGNGSAGAADVAWYQFNLDRPADVRLTAGGAVSFHPLLTTLSLYNSDPFDIFDAYDQAWTRLLAQSQQGDSAVPAMIDRPLAKGTYYVAVSGAGNCYFYPFLAGSGTAGSTGDYALDVTATDLGLDPLGTPQLLSADVSPQIVRLGLSAPIDPASTFTLTDSAGNPVNLLWSDFGTNINEIQLAPAQALAAGTYNVAVTDGSGNLTLTATFQVTEGAAFPDDTAATARELGDVTRSGLVQVAGAIGDDPYYDAFNPDPALNPGNQVNLYHFRLSGPGRYAVVAEVFAGRIGSPLFAGVSLYRLDPTTGLLDFVQGNVGTGNPTQASQFGFPVTPLFTDPALSAGLTAGDYYVAVSSVSNTPSPDQGQLAGAGGIFDANVSRSGSVGFSTGPYVLNLLAYPAPAPPTVVSASVSDGQTLAAPPVRLTVRFSAPVNLSQLALAAFQQTSQDTVSAVFVAGTDPTTGQPVKYFPRLESYDNATNQATFLMLDGLANGDYALHLSGPAGLTDAAGNPLAGNDPSGDYVIRFRVQGPARGQNGSPLVWADQEPNGNLSDPQSLGVLFPHELQAGVSLSASFGPGAPAGSTHYYSFQVLQGQTYFFGFSGNNLPADASITLYDTAGDVIGTPTTDPLTGSQAMNVPLDPGTYVIGVSWTSDAPDSTQSVAYALRLDLLGDHDNAPPLLSGPTPAVQIRLDGAAVAAAPAPAPAPSVALPGVAPATTTSATSGSGGVQFAIVQTVQLAPSAPPAPASGIAPSSGSLLALADGPVGGSARGGSGGVSLDQVAIRLPDPSPAANLVDATVATLLVGSGLGSAPTAPGQGGLIDQVFGSLGDTGSEVLNQLMRPLRPLLDGLLPGSDWWQEPRPPAGPDGAPPAMPAPGESGAPGDVLPESESSESGEGLSASEGAQALGLVLAAAVAGVWIDPERRGRRFGERRE
jgi:methionine-rich copper-binding protein CopC